MFREIDRPGIAMLLVPCARPDPIQPPVTKVRGACGTFPRPPPIPPGTLITSGWPAVFSRRCRWALPRPDRVYYSHDGAGEEIEPYHTNAISMLFDQDHEMMEGASGGDWMSVAQSMRAYLRFSVRGAGHSSMSSAIGCSAVKPIVSRRRSASELSSNNACRIIMSLVVIVALLRSMLVLR